MKSSRKNPAIAAAHAPTQTYQRRVDAKDLKIGDIYTRSSLGQEKSFDIVRGSPKPAGYGDLISIFSERLNNRLERIPGSEFMLDIKPDRRVEMLTLRNPGGARQRARGTRGGVKVTEANELAVESYEAALSGHRSAGAQHAQSLNYAAAARKKMGKNGKGPKWKAVYLQAHANNMKHAATFRALERLPNPATPAQEVAYLAAYDASYAAFKKVSALQNRPATPENAAALALAQRKCKILSAKAQKILDGIEGGMWGEPVRNPAPRQAQVSLFGGGEDLPLFASKPRAAATVAPLPKVPPKVPHVFKQDAQWDELIEQALAANIERDRLDRAVDKARPTAYQTMESSIAFRKLDEARSAAYLKAWQLREKMDMAQYGYLRNPSSGARQRVRGTRAYTQRLSGGFADGASHERYMQLSKVARGRLRASIAQNMPYEARTSKEMHKGFLGAAEIMRPRLPNPGTQADADYAAYMSLSKAFWVKYDQAVAAYKALTPYQQQRTDKPTHDDPKMDAFCAAIGHDRWDAVTQHAVRESRRPNPSSGARQRARGTRAFTANSMTAGARHEFAMQSARSSVKGLSNRGWGFDESAVRMHGVDLRRAAANRPRLPNPAGWHKGQFEQTYMRTKYLTDGLISDNGLWAIHDIGKSGRGKGLTHIPTGHIMPVAKNSRNTATDLKNLVAQFPAGMYGEKQSFTQFVPWMKQVLAGTVPYHAGTVRNPSSGARQRTRGTRIIYPFTPAWSPETRGERHADLTRQAENLRKELPTYKSPQTKYWAKQAHAEALSLAADRRPRLPNPATPFWAEWSCPEGSAGKAFSTERQAKAWISGQMTMFGGHGTVTKAKKPGRLDRWRNPGRRCQTGPVRPAIYLQDANGYRNYQVYGVGKKVNLAAYGWEWSRGVGCPGAWITDSAVVAQKLGLPILPHPSCP